VHSEYTDEDDAHDEQEHGALHGDVEKLVMARAVGLPADRLHAHGEPPHHRVACDVCEADDERPVSERQSAKAAEEDQRGHGAEVEKQTRQDHRQREVQCY
jgi:hypothetical protein